MSTETLVKPCPSCQERERVQNQPYCKPCGNAKGREWHAANRDRVAQRKQAKRLADPESARDQDRISRERNPRSYEDRRNAHLRLEFGITLDDYHEMLDAQDGRCGICESTEAGGRWGTFAVDHDHTTGAVRGLLCHPCNRGLGQLGDTLERVESALNYLKGHRNG